MSHDSSTIARGGVIFDMDGLMLDTESIAQTAWEQAFARTGRTLTPEMFGRMIGRNKRDCAELMGEWFGADFDFGATYRQCGMIYEELIAAHGLPLKPGVMELLRELAARGVPLAVATSTRQPKARQRLEQAGLLGFFAVVVAGDEVVNGKPAPEIYREAARRLGIDPALSFALEDSHAGVRAAHAAGLKVIMVPDLLPATEEIEKLTHRVVPSLEEVLAVLDEFAQP
jgi:HAD superfamily hydrolase (TIGR01509 family)